MTGEKNSKQKIVEKINVIILILIECEIYMILKFKNNAHGTHCLQK